MSLLPVPVSAGLHLYDAHYSTTGRLSGSNDLMRGCTNGLMRGCRHDRAGLSRFYVEHGTWTFAIRKWLGSAKFWCISQLMSALGYASLAKKVWAGWQVRALFPSRQC